MSVTVRVTDDLLFPDNKVVFFDADGWVYSNAGDLIITRGNPGIGFYSIAAGKWLYAEMGSIEAINAASRPPPPPPPNRFSRGR